MTALTFDTAWIIANIRHRLYEELKEEIRTRLADRQAYYDEALANREDFETTCWAWQHGVWEIPWSGGKCYPKPAVNPYPYRDSERAERFRLEAIAEGCKPHITAYPDADHLMKPSRPCDF